MVPGYRGERFFFFTATVDSESKEESDYGRIKSHYKLLLTSDLEAYASLPVALQS
jgi:hypothetical protein